MNVAFMLNEDRDEAATTPGSLLTELPGKARSRAQARKSFEDGAASLRWCLEPVLGLIIVPKAWDIYRWRLQLECGCVHEIFTRGDEDYPDARRWSDPITGSRLPVGEHWCSTDHGEDWRAYHDIVDWLDYEIKKFPPDPTQSPYESMDPITWAKIRRSKPRSSALWRVRLSCGHICDPVVTDAGWNPEDGPNFCTKERTAEMRRSLEAAWHTEGHRAWPEEGVERDHIRKMLDLRWPWPEPEQECFTCRYAWRMTGYQRIGWLVPRGKSAQTPDSGKMRKKAEARLAKKMAEGRLAELEAEVHQLREQLGLTADQ